MVQIWGGIPSVQPAVLPMRYHSKWIELEASAP
jgi:hypothetical protein